jgi:hypothetical protein
MDDGLVLIRNAVIKALIVPSGRRDAILQGVEFCSSSPSSEATARKHQSVTVDEEDVLSL